MYIDPNRIYVMPFITRVHQKAKIHIQKERVQSHKQFLSYLKVKQSHFY